jgi:hypothetical protein
MSDKLAPPAARSKADKLFTASQQRDDTVRQIIEKERAATAAKTAKLRALRLAKEEADRKAAAELRPVAPSPKKRARKS